MRCINPFTTKNAKHIPLPCGKCTECKKRRISGWSFRLLKEAEAATSAFFLTLTYDTENVPITKKGYMTLERGYWQEYELCTVIKSRKVIKAKKYHKSEIQLWLGRLRKASGPNMKYYLVGEYGTKNMRPHYHVILFNVALETIIGKEYAQIALADHKQYLKGKHHYYPKSWYNQVTKRPIGHVTIGEVSAASVGYCLVYIGKPSQIPKHKNDDRLKEFSIMSKGIGAGYLTPQMIAWHKANPEERFYIPIKDNKKIAIPRYISNKLYTKSERENIGLALREKAQEEYKQLSEKEKVKYMEKYLVIRESKVNGDLRSKVKLTI